MYQIKQDGELLPAKRSAIILKAHYGSTWETILDRLPVFHDGLVIGLSMDVYRVEGGTDEASG